MKTLNYIIVSTLVLFLVSCGSDNESDNEPLVTETYSAFFVTPTDGVVEPSYFEEFSASQIVKWIPCEITTDTKEVVFDKGGTESIEYTLTLNKWRDATLAIDTLWIKDFAVHTVDYTIYKFTPGEYTVQADGNNHTFLVKEDYIALINPYTGEEWNTLISLTNCQRIYSNKSETPLRTYQNKSSNSYSKSFSLVKLADDHFYIENDDHTFEGYINAQGVLFNQIKPDEKEIGLLYR